MQGHLLGCGHSHNAGHRNGLGKRELRIAGARGEVDHQHIPFTPGHLIQELTDDAVEHRSAPDHRLVFVNEQTHGDHGHPTALDGAHALLTATPLNFWSAVCHPQHRGGIRPIDVGIQQANAKSLLGQGAGQIDGHGALAHSALAAADGNHLFHSGDRLALRDLAMTGLADAAAALATLLRSWASKLDLNVVNTVEFEKTFTTLLGDAFPLALGKAGKAEADDGPRWGDAYVFDPTQIEG